MFLIFTILLSFTFVFANDEICEPDSEAVKMAKELSIPNCIQRGIEIQKLCDSCKSSFEIKYKKVESIKDDEKKKIFLETALKEYQKNITNNLIESLKLRSLEPTGANFSKSVGSCKMRNSNDFTQSCGSKSAVSILKSSALLPDFDKRLKAELAKVLSTDPKNSLQEGLLKRTASQCFIPEKDLLLLNAAAVEESLTPEIIETFLALDPKKFNDMNMMLLQVSEEYDGEVGNLFDSMKSHPLLAHHLKTPNSMISFLKSIPEPRNLENLKKSLYNKKSGDDFDERLAKSCEDSYSNLVKSICSKEFENGEIYLSPIDSYERIYAEVLNKDKELASTELSLRQNIRILRMCEKTPKKNDLTLSKAINNISNSLDPTYSQNAYDTYKVNKYTKDFANNNMMLCENKEPTCTDKTFSCRLLMNYKDLKNKDSRVYKLANSSNTEVNAVIRSMIGDTSKLDPETKMIFVAQGIIPKDDGTLVSQADIPERRSPSNSQSSSIVQAGAKEKSNSQVSAKPSRSQQAFNDSDSDSDYSPSTSSTSASTHTSYNPDFSDLTNNDKDLAGVQDEIRRRLSDPAKRPTNINEAKKIASDSFRSRGKTITPEQENAFATRMMQQPSQSMDQADNSASSSVGSSSSQATASGSPDSKAAQWKRNQAQEALMGMAGAQQAMGIAGAAGAGAAAEAKPKDLTKVALNIADDPKVNLSEVFNKKLDLNDTETQMLKTLLKNKNNFLLQLKGMNFKVVFNDKNSFNLLLESGDKKEAERIRPQLEIFLNKLKRNSTLSNLSNSW
jgi:hypothetical protein